MNTVDLFRSLLPAYSYDPNGKHLTAELQAEANLMDDVRASAVRVLGSVTPFYSSMTLSDWERVYDLVPREGATQQERRQNVLTKMAATGGLSIPYFIKLAASMGYTIAITEPRAFQAGVNRCGDRLYMEDIRWVWLVNVLGDGIQKYKFRAGMSASGEPLLSFGESQLEGVFQDLKPAFTYCYFSYEDNK